MAGTECPPPSPPPLPSSHPKIAPSVARIIRANLNLTLRGAQKNVVGRSLRDFAFAFRSPMRLEKTADA